MRKLWVCLCCVLCLSACTAKVKDEKVPQVLQEYKKYVNAAHAQIIPNPIQTDAFSPYANSSEAYYRAMDYVIAHGAKTNGEESVTQQEALQDVEDVFFTLKALYGKYPIYGDARFQEAKQMVDKQIKTYAKIKKTKLGEVLRKQLSFIEDVHFQIDFEPLHESYTTYSEQGVHYQKKAYVKKKDGYYDQSNQKRIVQIHKDADLATYLKPVLHKDGSISYQLFYRSRKNITHLSMRYADGSERKVAMEKVEQMKHSEDILTEKIVQGIPYLHITKMIYPRASDTYAQYAETFLARAAQFSQKPLAILDLRGNPGGNAMLSYAWSHSYAKQRLSGYGARMLRLPLHEQKFKQLMDEKTDQSLASLLEDGNYQKHDNLLYIEKPYMGKKLIKNKSILLVLQDETSASASEMLMDELHTMENVIFIGMPSAGAISGSAMSSFYLDKSGLQIMFGNLYGDFPETYASEYQGIAPDIWVQGKDVLKYVKELLK